MTADRAQNIIPKFFLGSAHISTFQQGFSLIRDLQNFGIMLRRGRQGRADQKAIVQGHPPVGFAQDRVLHQEFDHRRFKIIGLMCPSWLCGQVQAVIRLDGTKDRISFPRPVILGT